MTLWPKLQCERIPYPNLGLAPRSLLAVVSTIHISTFAPGRRDFCYKPTSHKHRCQMGLRMDDLHAPTVASGPTSNNFQNGDSRQQSLMSLINEKDNVQAELQALGSVLDSVCPRYPYQTDLLADEERIAWRQHEHDSHDI